MTAQHIDTADVQQNAPHQHTASAIMSAVLGWSLDLFDLFLILYVAPIIAPLFFPSRVPTFSLAAVYASFAVTVLLRPAGSAIFGAYADRQGRKRAMIVAVVGVGTATALLGALPTFAQAGLAGPLTFLFLRVVQGIFVGGVVASTHTIGTETVAPRWRGLMSGLIGGGGAAVGSLIASITFAVWSAVFPGASFAVWGWRAMFFTGLLTTVFGLFIFRSLEESPLWLEEQKRHAKPTKMPLRTVFSGRYFPILLVNLLVVAGAGTQYYLTSGYLPTFLSIINHVPKTPASFILIAASVFILISALLVGHMSELIGRKRAVLIVGVVNLIVIPMVYLQLAGMQPGNIGMITIYVLVLSFLGNAAYAPVVVFLNERFPTAIRASGTGLSWNIGFAVGGITPTFVTLVSPQVKNIPLSLVFFLVGALLVFLIGGLLVPETRGNFE